jgi:Flp pilus assembly protein TadG
MRRTQKGTRERGQVLVMFVGGMVGLLALAALAIGLSSVYSTQQTEKAAADAAALAGAQNLQLTGSRTLGDPATVRTRALEDLAGRFGVAIPSGGACNPTTNITDCPLLGTPYHVAISAMPSKTLTTSDPRSVQVSVNYPGFQVSFAFLFGQNGWNVGETSVAVLANAGQYAVITLRPPNPNQTSDSNASDITINGVNGALNVYDGDIGTNTSVRPAPGTISFNSTDYYVRYFDTTAGWGASPPGKPILSLIPDPKYPYPLEGSTAAGGVDSGATCTTLLAAFNTTWYHLADSTYTAANTTCYTPGKYAGAVTFPNAKLAILEPGVYFFDGGMNIKGTVVGGIVGGSPGGVAVLVPQTKSIKMTGTPPMFALNMGTDACVTPTSCTGTVALPATWSGTWSDGVVRPVNSPVQSNTKIPLPLSVIVPGDPSCPVVMPAPNCGAPAYQTIDYSGAGKITVVSIAGVQYAPSDNAKIAGSDAAYGYEGQIVSWTLTYTGNSVISEHYGGGVGNAVVRLDTTCSGGGSSCNP